MSKGSQRPQGTTHLFTLVQIDGASELLATLIEVVLQNVLAWDLPRQFEHKPATTPFL